MSKKIFAIAVMCLLVSLGYAQKDPTLFSVEGKNVKVSEFEYIYTKTNGDKADFSRESLDEYLGLYKKFKLKVQRARDMQLDTIPSLQQELEGYRKQLADSYLTDKEVTERLVRELYERSQQDIDMSHLMIQIKNPQNPSPADTLAAYQKITGLLQQIQGGASFAQLAQENSADPSAKGNNGRLGFVTAPLPKGFYHLENAVYNTPPGTVVGPVRTGAGYHLVQTHGKRSARGEVEAAHILIRTTGKTANDIAAKKLIDSLHQALVGGADFEALAKAHSQDKANASKGGYIGFFGINRYDLNFENAAFALQQDGAISEPIQSQVGWHIVRRISKKGVESYDLAKRRLQAKVKRDPRFGLARAAMIERIKTEGDFSEEKAVLDQFIAGLGEDYLSHKWKAGPQPEKAVLFRFGDKNPVYLNEFSVYCQRSSRARIRGGSRPDQNPESVTRELYREFVTDRALQYEEAQLEKKYPEFRALMREYEEGILLFEATKMLVWDKASQDTTGLQNYFEQHRKDYMWEERARVITFTVKPEGQKNLAKIRKFARKNAALAVLEKFNTDEAPLVAYQSKTVEKGKDDVIDSVDWTVGNITDSQINNRNKSSFFYKIETVLPPTEKTLQEARGYVIADYQDYLEAEWIKELQADYKVKVNQKAFDALVKK